MCNFMAVSAQERSFLLKNGVFLIFGHFELRKQKALFRSLEKEICRVRVGVASKLLRPEYQRGINVNIFFWLIYNAQSFTTKQAVMRIALTKWASQQTQQELCHASQKQIICINVFYFVGQVLKTKPLVACSQTTKRVEHSV